MIYLFDRQKKLQKIIPKKHLLSAIQTVELNGLYQLSVEVPLFYETKSGTQYNYKKNVEKAWFAGHYDRKKRFQLYKIHTRKVRADNKRILLFDGVHIFFDEAKAMGNIHDRRFREYDVKPVADAAFNPIGWYVKDYDVTDTTDINFYRDSVANARSLIIEKFGVEFDYGLTFDGRKIISKDLYIKKRLGKWTGKRFAYGTNLLSLTQEQDESEVYTAAVGRGRGEEVGDGFGPRLEFGDIEWSKDGITSPVGQNWIEILSATAEYGYFENGEIHPRVMPEVIFENVENKQLLADSTYQWLLENCVPKATWKTDVARVGAHDLGDGVGVIYKQADIIKKARIHKMENNLLDDNLSKITLGDYQHFKTDRRQQNITAQLKRNRSDTQSYITQLKVDFDARYDAQTTAINNAYQQAVIDAKAETDAAEERMQTKISTQRGELTTAIDTAKSQAITQAEQDAAQKADAVQGDLDKYKQQSDNHIHQIVGGDVSSITKSILDMNNWQDQKGVIIDDVNDAISGRVWSSDITNAIDDIELGTRNMLLDTDGETTIDQTYKRWDIVNGALHGHVGKPVTLSFEAKSDTNGEIIRPYFTGDGIHTIDNMELTTEWKKYSVTFTLDSESYKTVSFHTNGYGGATVFTGHVRKIKFEKGDKATDHTLAPEDLIQFTDFKLLSDGFSIGTTKVGGKEFATGIVGDAEGLSLIGDNVDVSNNLTVQNTVKAWGIEAVTGDFANIVGNTADIQFIKNKHLATESVDADKLKVNAALIDKLVVNTAFANEIKTMSIDAAKANFASATATWFGANMIESDWLKVDTALLNRFTSDVGFINSLTSKTAFIRDVQAIDIDFTRATARGSDGNTTLTIKNTEVISHGEFTRTWADKTDTALLNLGIRDGRIMISNEVTGYNLYMTEKGLSTTMAGATSGYSAGTIEFHSQRYNEVSRGITVHSTFGAVALVTDRSTVVTHSYLTNNIESETASVYIRPLMDNRSGVNEFQFYVKDNQSGWNTDGTILYGSITEGAGAGSGIRFKKDGRNRPVVYATNLYGDINTGDFSADQFWGTGFGTNSINLYAMVDNEFRITSKSGYNGGNINYKDIRTEKVFSDSIWSHQYSDYWIRVDDELKVTSQSSTSDYKSIRSGKIITQHAGAFKNYGGSGSPVYFGVGFGEMRITDNGHYNGGSPNYQDIKFANWRAMSHEKYKNSIEEWHLDVLPIFRNELQLYNYKLNTETGTENELIHQGIILRENSNHDRFPSEWREGDGFNGNKVMWWAVKGVQELAFKDVDKDHQLQKLFKLDDDKDKRIKALEEEVKILREAGA